MKYAALIALLFLNTTFNTVYAAEMPDGSVDAAAYCDEQAQMAGIEDADEKSQYVKECVDSFGAPSDGSQTPNE